MTSERQFEDINIRALATRLNPKLGKLIPGFVYPWFERILHIKEINEFLRVHNQDNPKDFIDSVVNDLLELKVNFIGQGFEEFEKYSGQGLIVASNHPLGGPEAIATLDCLLPINPDIKLVAQSFLKFIEPLSTFCVYNKKDVRTLFDHVNEKKPFLIYPAGYCSRLLSFKDVFDYQWYPSFVKVAKKNNSPIIVVYTDGKLSRRTINWTKFRNFFGIKKSIETLFLVDEMFKLKGQTLNITVGKAIMPDSLSDDVDNSEWALRLRQYCYSLKTDPNCVFDPSVKATLPLK